MNNFIANIVNLLTQLIMYTCMLIGVLQCSYILKYGISIKNVFMAGFFFLGALACGFMLKHQKKEKAVQQQPKFKNPANLQRFISNSKACNKCGDKLAVCLEGFAYPRLATGLEPGECIYYCPECKEYFPINQKEYQEYSYEDYQQKPNLETGERYHLDESYFENLKKRAKLYYGITSFLVVAMIICFAMLINRTSTILIVAILLISAISSFTSSVAVNTSRNIKSRKNFYYQITDEGLLHSDGVFCMWEDFKMVSLAEKNNLSFSFFTHNTNFVLTQQIDNYIELTSKIIDNILNSAIIEQEVLEIYYNFKKS